MKNIKEDMRRQADYIESVSGGIGMALVEQKKLFRC